MFLVIVLVLMVGYIILQALVGAIESLWPKVEHRLCAKHIYSNWRKQNRGKV